LIKIISSSGGEAGSLLNAKREIELKFVEVLYVLFFLFFLSCAGPSPSDIAKLEKGQLFPVEKGESWGFIDRLYQ
jgi:hypothetical protein